MRGDFRLKQGHGVRTTGFTQTVQRQSRALARMHRRIALHVRQREVGLAVSAVGRAEQRKKRGVLRQRQNLSVAKGPTHRCEIEWKNPDFSDKRIHEFAPAQVCDGKMPNNEMMKSTHKY